MYKLGVVLLAAAGIAAAQGIDLGALGGAGGFTASGPTLGAGQVGVEACVFCGGRFGLFGEYGHWFTSGVAQVAVLVHQKFHRACARVTYLGQRLDHLMAHPLAHLRVHLPRLLPASVGSLRIHQSSGTD